MPALEKSITRNSEEQDIQPVLKLKHYATTNPHQT